MQKLCITILERRNIELLSEEERKEILSVLSEEELEALELLFSTREDKAEKRKK